MLDICLRLFSMMSSCVITSKFLFPPYLKVYQAVQFAPSLSLSAPRGVSLNSKPRVSPVHFLFPSPAADISLTFHFLLLLLIFSPFPLLLSLLSLQASEQTAIRGTFFFRIIPLTLLYFLHSSVLQLELANVRVHLSLFLFLTLMSRWFTKNQY